MAVKLYCIFTVIVAPLLVVIHWLRYHNVDSTQQQSSVKVMMDSSGSDSSNSIKSSSSSGGTGEEWMNGIASNEEVSPLQQRDYPCKDEYSHLPHCNTALSKEERIQYIISQLNTKEKISLLGHDSPSIKHTDLYLPEYKWWNEGLHVAWTDCCPPYKWKNVTVFPQVIGLSMSFNRTLWSEIGNIIGTEALQRVHDTTTKSQIHPGLTYFTPNINIFRDPRWGRGQETPGEDPYLTSHYAAVIIMSLQYGNGFLKELYDRNYTKTNQLRPRISATCKHFAAYSLETNRFTFSANISEEDWNDTYLPAFDACIHAEQFLNDYFEIEEESVSSRGALGIMCSYNSVDGVPSCANTELLQMKLRHEWKYSGYVVSDCWAIANIYESHDYTSSLAEAAGVAIKSGVDLDCGDTVQGHGYKALQEGYMTMKDVDRALSNLFGVLVDVGYFDQDEHQTQTKDDTQARVQYHNQVAVEAALQSIVLLKNGDDESSPLPLSTTTHRKITLVGPLAHDKVRGKGDVLLGNYHGVPTNIITPKDGLEDLGLEVEYYQGCDVTDKSPKGSSVQKEDICQQMSDKSDATILVMGLSQDIESESLDRTTLQLPDIERETIQKVSRCANPNTPVILVIVTGGVVDVSPFKENKDLDAILYTSYSGQAGGEALAEVIYGMHNPSGRLTTTIYQNSYMNEVDLEDMQMRPHKSSPGRTYRFYEGPLVVYPFGYGLSYSKWDYSMEMEKDKTVAVKVSNKAGPDGSNSVLLYHQGPNAGKKGNPIKALIDFEKVYVSAGDSQNIKFNIERWMKSEEEGTHTFMIGPSDEYALQIKVP